MKKLTTIFLLVAFTTGLFAEIAVKSFRKLETDLDARVYAKKIDQNGDVCAIIKVVTTQNGFFWEPDGLGIMSAEWKNGEYWLYLPYGAKRLTIKHDKLGILRDYMYPMPIEKATVYEMILVSGKVITSVEDEIATQWLIINTEPADAMVYIDGQFVKSGLYQAKVKPGNYTYKVEAPMYYPEIGRVTIENEKKELNVKLKPAFGNISLSCEPEQDAKVIIDGRLQQKTTPCTSEPLMPGEHTVQVLKEMYHPVIQKITVAEGQITPVKILLQPNFADITISTISDATIYINNQLKATGSWQGKLSPGVYTLEARINSYRTAKQDIEVIAGDKRIITLEPTPIYGTLDVISTPAGATIRIDSTTYETTPSTIERLLIGKHTIQLMKPEYATKTDTVSIVEGKNTEFNTTLEKGRSVAITSNPSDLDLYVDNIYIGKTPQKMNLSCRNHEIRIQKDGKKTENTINIQETGGETFFDLSIQSLLSANKPHIADSTKISQLPKRKDIYLFGGIAIPITDAGHYEYNNTNLHFGIAKKMGVYAGFTTQYFSTKESNPRLGIVGGLIYNMKINQSVSVNIPSSIPIVFYVGAGGGISHNYNSGLETEAGIIIMKPLGITFGISSVAFKYFELKLGACLVL